MDKIIAYRISSWSDEITEREIIRTSDTSVFYINSRGKEEREKILTTYHKWFLTRNEAIKSIQDKYAKFIEYHSNMVTENHNKLQKFNETLL